MLLWAFPARDEVRGEEHNTMRCPNVSSIQIACLAAFALFGPAAGVNGDEPLHVRIDRLMEAGLTGPVAGECTDAEFLRRVSLDLNGTIPTADEARAYLDDSSPDQRTALVVFLLMRRPPARPLLPLPTLLLMERRRDTHVKSAEWQKYLHDSVAANKPFNQLAREILSADGADETLRPAAKFYLDRLAEPHLLTRDVGRIFFGRDLQCAQCHNHPLIDDYLQDDYYGIYAFLSRSSLFTDNKAKKSFLAESADGEAAFESVFTLEKSRTRPRLPSQVEIDEPVIPAAEAYTVKPAKDVRPVPKYSRRAELAKRATDGTNGAFNRNIANRLWAHMMGRGLVHPLDLHHPDNPPSNPELLELLADEFAAMNFDMQAFLRELALTKTYRRGFDMPAGLADSSPSIEAKITRLKTEQAQQSAAVDALYAELDKLRDGVIAAQESVFTAEKERDKTAAALAAAQKESDKAKSALAASQKQLPEKEQSHSTLNEALAKADEVVKQFPKDAELIAAADTYRKRVKVVADEIAALKTTIEQQTAAAKAAEEKTVEPARLATAAAEELATQQKNLAELRGPYLEKLYAYRRARTLAEHQDRQTTHLQTLLTYRAAVAKQQDLIAATTTAREELDRIQTAASQVEADIAAAADQLITSQRAHAAALKIAKPIRDQYAQQAKLARQVSEAAAAGQAAMTALPDDEGLTTGTAQLDTLAAHLNGELAPLAEQLKTANDQVTATQATLQSAQEQLTAAKAVKQDAEQRTADANKKLQAAQEGQQAQTALVENLYGELTGQLTGRFATSALKPLSPEQLSWSIMQATGVVAQQKSAAVAELDKKGEKDEPQRAAKVEAAVYDKLRGNVATFVKTFGAGDGQPQNVFFATVDQALFFTNGGEIRGWLNPAGTNLTARLKELTDPAACAEELYLAIFTRRPAPEETADVIAYLEQESKSDRTAAVQELAWAMLTSAEFRFEH